MNDINLVLSSITTAANTVKSPAALAELRVAYSAALRIKANLRTVPIKPTAGRNSRIKSPALLAAKTEAMNTGTCVLVTH